MYLQQVLEKYIPLISGMIPIALVFSVGLLSFLIKGDFEFNTALECHWLFYGCCIGSIILLLNFNRGYSLFITVSILISYMAINFLKQKFGPNFIETGWFLNLETLFPLNIIIFYVIPIQKFISKPALICFCLICLEYTLCEFLAHANITIEIIWREIPLISFCFFGLLLVVSIFKASKNGKVYDYGMIFCSGSLWCSFIFVNQPSGLSLFYLMAQFFLFSEIVYTLVRECFYDVTGAYSRRFYITQARHLPLKYSLGLMRIDNYKNLMTAVGWKYETAIVTLVYTVIQEMAPDAKVYRYLNDTFVIIFKTLDRKEAHKEIDKIRHTIAGLAFEYVKDKKTIKLTISCSVAEKKRSDTGVENVLQRAETEMLKSLKFSHNMTIMA